MKLQLVGCSHRRSSVATRERLAFSPAQAEAALEGLRERFPRSEAVLLSTCNRVEVYTAAEDAEEAPTQQDVAEFLAGFHGLDVLDIFDDLFERTGEDAVRHLFTVAASLDSMVVGETQILAQVKRAYDLALAHGNTGPYTNQIFQAALRVARRVATETSINEKRVSIASLAVADFAKRIFERFDDKRVLVIGAGEIGAETLRYLQDEGACDVTVVNRDFERAAALAQRWGGRAVPWERLGESLAAADLVISTTGAERPVVLLADFQRIEPARYQRDLCILDLAIPRDFDPAIADSKNVYLYTLDDLEAACQRNRRERERELPAARRIVEQETAQFMAELRHHATGPIIKRLRQGWEDSRDDELRRLFNRLPDLSDRQRDEIRKSFNKLINTLLHPPLESLRDAAHAGTLHAMLDTFKKLFHLKD
ncbi:MAG TPA: glutamyl-tRNA reductase [Pirellulales bacterium]|jgi:glutamyl-tRNA reductase|nr:glutamyl-tRNA reductase [Pirellulales bacterium]